MSRAVICHYHIFKNSGTTFEGVLDDNFGEGHLRFDGPFSYFNITQDQLCNILERNPETKACSSHQIHLPAPSSVDFQAIPVVFLRHPLLRIRSIYLFNTRDQRDEDDQRDPLEGFEAWLTDMLSSHNSRLLLSNAQTNMICRPYNQGPRSANRGGRLHYDLHTAVNNLNNVPCLGRTEHFDEDVKGFEATLNDYGIDFSYTPRDPENVSSSDFRQPVEEQLSTLQSALSASNWETLQFLNDQDLELYELGCRLVELRASGAFPALRPRHTSE